MKKVWIVEVRLGTFDVPFELHFSYEPTQKNILNRLEDMRYLARCYLEGDALRTALREIDEAEEKVQRGEYTVRAVPLNERCELAGDGGEEG